MEKCSALTLTQSLIVSVGEGRAPRGARASLNCPHCCCPVRMVGRCDDSCCCYCMPHLSLWNSPGALHQKRSTPTGYQTRHISSSVLRNLRHDSLSLDPPGCQGGEGTHLGSGCWCNPLFYLWEQCSAGSYRPRRVTQI